MSSIIEEVNKQSFEKEIDDYFFSNQKNDQNDEETDKELNCEESMSIEDEEEIIMGIDLGTSNSLIGIWRNNNFEIIPDSYGNRSIPSIIAFTPKSKYIGKEAKNQIELNSENTFYEVKRLIGRKFSDETVQNDLEFITFGIKPDLSDNIQLYSQAIDRNFTPEEISAYILKELKYMAEYYLKKPINKVVITVPAYFNDSQRQATKDAAIIAGLDCVRIINEPTAAALVYGLANKTINDSSKDINVLVYDLGGGTLDLSLLNISNGMFQVLASAGNTHLGGSDFDNRLINFCLNEFKKKYKLNNIDDLSSISYQKLRKGCEDAKKRLSEVEKTTIAIKEFYKNQNLFLTITRGSFEKICRDLFILCLKPLDDILKNTDLDKSLIDEIILVGGATRMPAIRNNLKLFFNGKELNTSINPDEVVAAGAAIQGFILSHDKDPFSENVVLLDIIPLSLGVETIGGVINVLIPRNSIIPIKRKKKFTTDSDYETSVKVKIFEGERPMTKDNFLVGEFELSGIESAPRGIAQIEINFSVDVNGIINVSAEDLKNEHNKKIITIKGDKGRLTPQGIKQIIKESEEMEFKDKIEREKKQLYYEIDDLCSNIKINANNNEFKLKDSDKLMVLTEIETIYSWLKEKDYVSRQNKEFLSVLEKLKKKYGTLILRVNTQSSDTVKGSTDSKVTSTTIYGNEDDEENIYEEIENEELGIGNDNDEKKKEIKLMRDSLISLCYTLFDIISSSSIKLNDNDITELREYVDDVLLWTHVKEKITLDEYKLKLEEVNNVSNDIVEKNNNIFQNEQNIDKKKELENLCFAIISTIDSNILSKHETKIQDLKNSVNQIIEWIVSIDADLNNYSKIFHESVYQSKIDELNSKCNLVYNSIIHFEFNSINIIDQSIGSTNDGTFKNNKLDNNLIDNSKGTSIEFLLNKS